MRRYNNLDFDGGSRKRASYIAVTLALAVVSLGVAFLWQKSESKSLAPTLANEKQEITPEISRDGKKYEEETIISKSEYVTSSYFDDACFIGDSLTTGIETYGILDNAKVLATIGINVDTIKSTPFYELEGKSLTALEALEELDGINKIYVMLGSNGIAWLSKDSLISSYREFVLEIQKIKPEATIYIQSILPVTKTLSDLANNISNDKIDQYNAQLVSLAKELGCYYVDVNSELKDEEGCLPEYASQSDGMHLTSEYYVHWIDYLKCHTAP